MSPLSRFRFRLHRRAWLLAALLPAATPGRATALQRGRALQFPADHGAHPDTRIEWWYATGALQAGDGRSLGFQITLFRSRTGLAQTLPGRLAPRQLLFGHAALTDVTGRTHRHAARLARWSGTPGDQRMASAALADTEVRIGDWSLRRDAVAPGGPYRAALGRLGQEATALALDLTPTQPLLLQGEAGWSRKGPQDAQARPYGSHYYSQPQLQVSGRVGLGKEVLAVRGTGWLDHEWADELLHPEAVGWDWIGFNLLDGSALTAFRLRRRDGSALWAGGSWREPGVAVQDFAADAVRFEPQRVWVSPQTGARYPVQWRVHTPAGVFEVQAELDAQELDSRNSTGAVYWEGLSTLRRVPGSTQQPLAASTTAGPMAGRGYLEMTGYVEPLRLG